MWRSLLDLKIQCRFWWHLLVKMEFRNRFSFVYKWPVTLNRVFVSLEWALHIYIGSRFSSTESIKLHCHVSTVGQNLWKRLLVWRFSQQYCRLLSLIVASFVDLKFLPLFFFGVFLVISFTQGSITATSWISICPSDMHLQHHRDVWYD